MIIKYVHCPSCGYKMRLQPIHNEEQPDLDFISQCDNGHRWNFTMKQSLDEMTIFGFRCANGRTVPVVPEKIVKRKQ